MEIINLSEIKGAKKGEEMMSFIFKLVETQRIDMECLSLIETKYNKGSSTLEVKLTFDF